MISASGEVGVSVMVKLCQRVLDEKGMANKCAGTNFKGKGDRIIYRGVKLLVLFIKIIERVLERIRELINIVIQFR